MNRSFKTNYLLTFFFIIISTTVLAGQYQVIRVVDGDTIVVRYGAKYEKVRMLYVNIPESVHPDKKQNIPMGKVASNYVLRKVFDKYVRLEFEIDRLRGKHGRLLAYVFVDGINLNLDLVRKGLSPYYTKYGRSEKYDDLFRIAEKLARLEKLNIWSDPELTEKYLRLKSKWGQRGEN